MSAEGTVVAPQFEAVEQQREASGLGMWVFLASEVLFFGALFAGYAYYRSQYGEAFALGSRLLAFVPGTANTAVLLVSSLSMALAVDAAETGRRRRLALFLAATLGLGALFLGVKASEFAHKYREGLLPGPGFSYHGRLAPEVQLFLSFYFVMAGVHAVHLLVGLGALASLLVRTRRVEFARSRTETVRLVGLYWHFVDVVWIFLYPLLYLAGTPR